MSEKLVLGLGDNIDYEIKWDGSVLERLAESHQIRPEELRTDIKIVDQRTLIVSILAFLRGGEGGERFVASPKIIEDFSSHFSFRVTMGGTPIRAAIAIAKLGYPSALHYVTMNDHVRRLTPPECSYVCSCREENSYPHLIIQFQPDARIKTSLLDLCAPRANRIIYDHDPENIQMEINESFARLCPDAKVFLLSGFNAMQEERVLRTRLASAGRIMDSLPSSAVVYYEDGGFYDDGLRMVIRDVMEKRIDIHGMNEDELQNYLGRKLPLLNARGMGQALLEIKALLGTRTILIHTQYWALAYGQNAEELENALMGGIVLAGTRYRFGDDFTLEQYASTRELPGVENGAAFARELKALLGTRVCCLPSKRIMEKDVTTIGLGDSFVGGFLSSLSEDSVVYREEN